MTAAVTTIAPTADHAAPPARRPFDRTALTILGAMLTLIVLLTVLLLETSFSDPAAAADGSAAPRALVVTPPEPAR